MNKLKVFTLEKLLILINFDEKLNVGNYKMPLHSKKISFPGLNNKMIKTNAEYPIEFKNLLMNLN